METVLLNKIYVLYHLQKVLQDNKRCYYDGKEIGQFLSIDEAKDVLKTYKKIQGFRDHPEGFQIDEYQVDSIYNEKINNLINANIKTKNIKTVYFLYYYREYIENGCEDVSILGIFSSEKLAKRAKENLVKEYPAVFTQYLVIYDRDIGELSWPDGFFIHNAPKN